MAVILTGAAHSASRWRETPRWKRLGCGRVREPAPRAGVVPAIGPSWLGVVSRLCDCGRVTSPLWLEAWSPASLPTPLGFPGRPGRKEKQPPISRESFPPGWEPELRAAQEMEWAQTTGRAEGALGLRKRLLEETQERVTNGREERVAEAERDGVPVPEAPRV